MRRPRQTKDMKLQKSDQQAARTIRASVSLRADLYRTLEAMTRQKKGIYRMGSSRGG